MKLFHISRFNITYYAFLFDDVAVTLHFNTLLELIEALVQGGISKTDIDVELQDFQINRS